MASSKRVLITGASGLLGRQLFKEFVGRGWAATGLAFSRVSDELRKLDLRDLPSVQSILSEVSPLVVVHAAAERRPDVVANQPEATEALNVSATHHLAAECAARGIFLVYISTDYVFDGTKPPYKPEDAPNPLNSYGRSKLDGELVVRQTDNLRSCVLRVPVLYGPVESLSESAVTVLLTSVLAEKQGSKVNNVQRRYPTHVQDVSAVCRGIAERALAASSASDCRSDDKVCSTYHWSGDEMLTKYEMAVAIADVFGLKKGHLVADEAVDESAVPRPHDCRLDCSAVEALGVGVRTPFRQGITAALAPYVKK